MNMKSSIILFFLIAIACCLPSVSSGRSIITGQVFNAETGKPIEGAAVYIYWGKSGEGPPGLAASSVKVEIAETLTDSEGFFQIPKYSILFNHFHMAIYKKGYVCWSSDKIFPTYEERKGFKLKNGMMIELEHFQKEYSEEDHANFVSFSSTSRESPGIFENAIKSELNFLYHKAQERRKERRNK